MNAPGLQGLPPLRPGEVEFRSKHRTLLVPIAKGRLIYFEDAGEYGYYRTIDAFEIEKLRIAVANEKRGGHGQGVIEMPSAPPAPPIPVFTGTVHVRIDHMDEIVVYVMDDTTWPEISAMVADQISQKVAQARPRFEPMRFTETPPGGSSEVWVQDRGWEATTTADDSRPVSDEEWDAQVMAHAVSVGAPKGRPIQPAPPLIHQSISPEDIAHQVAAGNNVR